ncbi:Leucine-rich PPR motif-containing protein, mitochondrial [Eumeta japonica]|uniref:Leucine-rich PPR motif-containing protein, mitochondrial n=1 Tax=Eumeta variegata TaxID=151549 RepID=A0A4C1Y110_EUMVA|nr:Leucine-rich PPR motif-containing protein, mitochondrial [Eumeta japonica]
MRQCERFADEKKVDVIELIAKCTKDLRHIATEELYDLVLDVYQRNDDCDNALALWYKMQEADVVPSKKFVQNICSMLKANNKNLPLELISLLDKETRSKILNQ